MSLPPKILIISSWAPPMIGGPQNLYNLFSQFPKESYAVLTSFFAARSGLEQGGQWLDGDYFFYDNPGGKKMPFTKPESPTEPKPIEPKSRRVNWLRGGAFVKKIYALFGTVAYPISSLRKTIRMTRLGVQAVRDGNFSVLLGISDTGPALMATYFISRRIKLPYYYYLYDIYQGNQLPWWDGLIARLFEGRLMRSARTVIVTNEGTAHYYHQRYGDRIHTAVVHNSVFAEGYEKQRTPYLPTPPYRIVFTGHVYWAQEQSVLNLVKAMDQLQDLPIELELYVPKPPISLHRAVAGLANVLLTSAPQSQMPVIQSRATLLYLPLAWHTKSPGIIATATPGKFTDYLASGRPMLVHAPDYAYVAQYAKEHTVGLVVDTDSVEQLAATIRNFLADPKAQGDAYITQALQIFYRNHDASKNSKKLASLLSIN